MRKLPLVAALGALLVAPSVASAATLKIDVVSNRADLISAGDALVEAFAVRALGGADTITVNDLAGTGVETVGVDLPADGPADTVVSNGTDGADAARVSRSGAQARVRGLEPRRAWPAASRRSTPCASRPWPATTRSRSRRTSAT